MGKDLLSIGAAAKFLNVSIDTLRRWDKEEKVHSVRIDGKNRFFEISELQNIKADGDNLKVSDAAKELGISASTLRRYGAKGFLVPERKKNGTRVYKKEALERLLYTANHSKIRSAIKDNEKLNEESEIYPNPSRKFNFLYALTGLLIILILISLFSTLYLRNLLLGGGNKITEIGKSDTATSKVEDLPIDADFLRGKFPGTEEINIPYFGKDGSISGLTVYEENLASGSVTGDKITKGAVTSLQVFDGSIKTIDIADDAITGIKIANDTIKNEDIAADAINSEKIEDGTITYSDIKDNTISTSQLASILNFENGDLIDLSDITHETSDLQGLILPNVSSPVAPIGGEGYLAYDTSGDQVLVYNGVSWESIGGNISLYAGSDYTANASSVSGLEIINSNELTLLRGCSDAQVLKWNDTAKNLVLCYR